MDISWYKNHIQANSVFAWNYEDDFFAGYDHGKEAGTMSVADHNIVPGKKFWTWGNGPSGQIVGQDPDRRRRPLHRADGGRLLGQPAGL